MHLKPYLIDLSLCLFALLQRKLALLSGAVLEVGEIDVTKLVSTAACFITGFTTLYRFIKEVKNDTKQNKSKESTEVKEDLKNKP